MLFQVRTRIEELAILLHTCIRIGPSLAVDPLYNIIETSKTSMYESTVRKIGKLVWKKQIP